jgi:hypothetical protein
MFERLAKFRSIAQWLKTPLGEPVRSHQVQSNDNRPGFRHPEGSGLRPHHALACHWFLVPGGTHLECRWELAAAGDRSTGGRGRSSHVAGPPLVPAIGHMAAREQIAS